MLRWMYGASSESWCGTDLEGLEDRRVEHADHSATKSHSPTATAGSDQPRKRTFASRMSAAAIERKNKIVSAGMRACTSV